MEISFRLSWMKPGNLTRGFKSEGARLQFLEYVKRISKFSCISADGGLSGKKPEAGTKAWVCEKGPGSRPLSSEELAGQIEKLQNEGVRRLEIIIGGADGFSKEELRQLKPDCLWSFGPLTLPHELAAVVASEQIYRAFTILKSHPYHSGH